MVQLLWLANNLFLGPQQAPTLKLLQRELNNSVASKWEDIGIQLDIDDGQLRNIKADNNGDSTSCLREMLRVWLKRARPTPSWEEVGEALECLGEQNLAEKLRNK